MLEEDDDNRERLAYEDALAYLLRFVNYEQRMAERYAPEKMDPTRPGRLLSSLGDPHREYPSIHIAGTKGKGSVAAMCAASLRAAGLRVGLYTSPHLQDVRERIRVLTPDDAGGYISREAFADLVACLQPAAETMVGLTWFELVTALAFLHFARVRVDAAVLEVGLGGRLDATNVVTPVVSVITSLSLDHTSLLGESVAEIAVEKGGIIKPDVPVVSASQPASALRQLERVASEQRAPFILVGREWTYKRLPAGKRGTERLAVTQAPSPHFCGHYDVGLAGAHQAENAVVALAALQQTQGSFPTVDRRAALRGLASVQWPGRLQLLYEGGVEPTLLLDGAHNADSAERLARALVDNYEYERLWLILGSTTDKNIPGILRPLLPLARGVIATQASHPRASSAETIAQAAKTLGYPVQLAADADAALRAAWKLAGPADLICVTGSLYLVGDLLNCWERLKSELISRRD